MVKPQTLDAQVAALKAEGKAAPVQRLAASTGTSVRSPSKRSFISASRARARALGIDVAKTEDDLRTKSVMVAETGSLFASNARF